jgi:NAD(P)-dependent dehydrogenase (short-subunit alcohol dehydrogenase family)
MSSQASESGLTQSGRERRRFLESSVVAAAGTSAAAWMTSMQANAQTTAAAATPANCPKVQTPMKDVEGKVAFITGGNSGIGLGIARAFTDAGMKVVITYRSKNNLDKAMEYLKSAGDRVHAVSVDVTDRAGMEKAAEETIKVFGKVHVLVANAGVGVIGGLSTASYDDWDWGMSVNLDGVFNSIHTFLPRIRSHGEGGHLIATSSLAGLLGHGPAGVYTATKFAVVGMMEALRFELEGGNIGVTVFCPGLVNTNIQQSERNRPAEYGDAGGGFKPDPELVARLEEVTKNLKSPPGPPGMDMLEAGQRVLRGMRNNDLYVLTSPEFEAEFRARGEAILASLPTDVVVPPTREPSGRLILGKTYYAAERDRRLCERQATSKA